MLHSHICNKQCFPQHVSRTRKIIRKKKNGERMQTYIQVGYVSKMTSLSGAVCGEMYKRYMLPCVSKRGQLIYN